jgi:hypothetical protein
MNKEIIFMGLVFSIAASPAWAGYKHEFSAGNSIEFGGYIKSDLRYVDGDVAYQDYWLGNVPSGSPGDTGTLGFTVRESRVNFKYTHDNASAFLEMDFYGGGGNEVVSNSSMPRVRQAFITYDHFLVGQTWTTFLNTASLPETLDFAGPAVGEVFIRQPQIRYQLQGFEFAIENPETNGDGNIGAAVSGLGLSGSAADQHERFPDFVGKYTLKDNWGQVSFAVLARKLNQGSNGIDKFAAAFSAAGKINIGQDDFRFQLNYGDAGRYVGPAFTADIVTVGSEMKVEQTTALVAAYRHAWDSQTRSSVFYANATTDLIGLDRTHWGINFLKNITSHLTAGVEMGQFSVDDSGQASMSSHYLQASMKFSI